jgi:agmatinase
VRAALAEEMVQKVYKRTLQYLNDNKFVMVVGGEHSVSIGSIKALFDYREHLSVLHLDAHADRRDSYNNSKFNHACVVARIREKTESVVSVGVRSMDISELSFIDHEMIFYADMMRASNMVIEDILAGLYDSVYVTIDLDVFDPGIMPSTGTHEPGGLGWYQMLDLLRSVASNRSILGFDVVELCPSYNKAPDFLAAKLIYKFLCYIVGDG